MSNSAPNCVVFRSTVDDRAPPLLRLSRTAKHSPSGARTYELDEKAQRLRFVLREDVRRRPRRAWRIFCAVTRAASRGRLREPSKTERRELLGAARLALRLRHLQRSPCVAPSRHSATCLLRHELLLVVGGDVDEAGGMPDDAVGGASRGSPPLASRRPTTGVWPSPSSGGRPASRRSATPRSPPPPPARRARPPREVSTSAIRTTSEAAMLPGERAARAGRRRRQPAARQPAARHRRRLRRTPQDQAHYRVASRFRPRHARRPARSPAPRAWPGTGAAADGPWRVRRLPHRVGAAGAGAKRRRRRRRRARPTVLRRRCDELVGASRAQRPPIRRQLAAGPNCPRRAPAPGRRELLRGRRRRWHGARGRRRRVRCSGARAVTMAAKTPASWRARGCARVRAMPRASWMARSASDDVQRPLARL